MKMSNDLEKKFQEQITLEFAASITYRQLAIEADEQDLPGIAEWLRHQADEEIVHANKFIDHLDARGNHPKIGDVSAGEVAPSQDPKQTFKTALHHEQRVSESIRELYRACSEAGDIDSNQLLNWFMSEQIEEEATVDEIVGRLEMTGDDGPGLLRLDAELGKRPQSGTEN